MTSWEPRFLPPKETTPSISDTTAGSEGVLASAPDHGAFRTDIADEAIANLEASGLDVTGDSWERLDVEVTEGGL